MLTSTGTCITSIVSYHCLLQTETSIKTFPKAGCNRIHCLREVKKVYSNYKLLLKPIVETVFLNFRSMNAAVNKMLERERRKKNPKETFQRKEWKEVTRVRKFKGNVRTVFIRGGKNSLHSQSSKREKLSDVAIIISISLARHQEL